MSNLTPLARKFLSQSPDLIGVVAGYRFYECLVLGDESPLIVISPEGRKKMSEFYDLPSLQDLISDSYIFNSRTGL